jgi:purine-binding chemotaxis protein CheW
MTEDFDNLTQDLAINIKQGELYLCFDLPDHGGFVLPAVGVHEVIQKQIREITPIPNSSSMLLGATNLRGQIIWVGYLARFLGLRASLNEIYNKSEISIIAIEEQGFILGLAVDSLIEIQWLDPEKMKSSSLLNPYILGDWLIQDQSKQIVRLLDHKKILHSKKWMLI